MSVLCENLLAVEENRLAGNSGVSVNKLDEELKKIIDDTYCYISTE